MAETQVETEAELSSEEIETRRPLRRIFKRNNTGVVVAQRS